MENENKQSNVTLRDLLRIKKISKANDDKFVLNYYDIDEHLETLRGLPSGFIFDEPLYRTIYTEFLFFRPAFREQDLRARLKLIDSRNVLVMVDIDEHNVLPYVIRKNTKREDILGESIGLTDKYGEHVSKAILFCYELVNTHSNDKRISIDTLQYDQKTIQNAFTNLKFPEMIKFYYDKYKDMTMRELIALDGPDTSDRVFTKTVREPIGIAEIVNNLDLMAMLKLAAISKPGNIVDMLDSVFIDGLQDELFGTVGLDLNGDQARNIAFNPLDIQQSTWDPTIIAINDLRQNIYAKGSEQSITAFNVSHYDTKDTYVYTSGYDGGLLIKDFSDSNRYDAILSATSSEVKYGELDLSLFIDEKEYKSTDDLDIEGNCIDYLILYVLKYMTRRLSSITHLDNRWVNVYNRAHNSSDNEKPWKLSFAMGTGSYQPEIGNENPAKWFNTTRTYFHVNGNFTERGSTVPVIDSDINDAVVSQVVPVKIVEDFNPIPQNVLMDQGGEDIESLFDKINEILSSDILKEIYGLGKDIATSFADFIVSMWNVSADVFDAMTTRMGISDNFSVKEFGDDLMGLIYKPFAMLLGDRYAVSQFESAYSPFPEVQGSALGKDVLDFFTDVVVDGIKVLDDILDILTDATLLALRKSLYLFKKSISMVIGFYKPTVMEGQISYTASSSKVDTPMIRIPYAFIREGENFNEGTMYNIEDLFTLTRVNDYLYFSLSGDSWTAGGNSVCRYDFSTAISAFYAKTISLGYNIPQIVVNTEWEIAKGPNVIKGTVATGLLGAIPVAGKALAGTAKAYGLSSVLANSVKAIKPESFWDRAIKIDGVDDTEKYFYDFFVNNYSEAFASWDIEGAIKKDMGVGLSADPRYSFTKSVSALTFIGKSSMQMAGIMTMARFISSSLGKIVKKTYNKLYTKFKVIEPITDEVQEETIATVNDSKKEIVNSVNSNQKETMAELGLLALALATVGDTVSSINGDVEQIKQDDNDTVVIRPD